ncbi:hypothetical protein BGX29_005333, partial [Mortierella sp. GBA35]
VDNNIFNTHQYAKQFNVMVKQQDLKSVKNTPVDITPILSLFCDWGSNESLALDDLICKTAWLLGVCGFMRPDCIRCIDVAKSNVQPNGILFLHLVAPKEMICPVKAYTAYLARLPQDLSALPHHKNSRRTPRPDGVPLFRHIHDPSKAIKASTISSKMKQITLHMKLSPGSVPPRCRAIGSTLAAFHGVALDD